MGLRINRSLPRINADLERASMPLGNEAKDAIQKSVENVAHARGVSRVWPLARAADGRCVYRASGSLEKAEISGPDGRERLMIQTVAGPGGVLLRQYALVRSMSDSEYAAIPGQTRMALALPRNAQESFRAGGSTVAIGKVAKLSVTATR